MPIPGGFLPATAGRLVGTGVHFAHPKCQDVVRIHPPDIVIYAARWRMTRIIQGGCFQKVPLGDVF